MCFHFIAPRYTGITLENIVENNTFKGKLISMIKFIKVKYFQWRVRKCQDEMDFTQGLLNVPVYMLKDNISWNISKACRDYYKKRLEFMY